MFNEAQVHAVERLLEFSSERSDDPGWGTGEIYGSFSPKFLNISTTQSALPQETNPPLACVGTNSMQA